MRRFRSIVSAFGFVLISYFTVFSTPVFAACDPTETQTDFGCLPNDPAQFVARFYGIGLGFVGGVAVLFIMYGGYLILTSQGNPQQLNKAKSYIFYAIVGLLLAIFGFVFMQTVAVDILHIPGFN